MELFRQLNNERVTSNSSYPLQKKTLTYVHVLIKSCGIGVKIVVLEVYILKESTLWKIICNFSTLRLKLFDR